MTEQGTSTGGFIPANGGPPRIQTEALCERCGYILRMQAVLPDPETVIPIVRCPECGQFQPPGSTAPPRRWLLMIVGGQTSQALGAVLWVLVVAMVCGSVYISFSESTLAHGVLTVALAAGVMLAACGHLYRLGRTVRLAVLLAAVLAPLGMILTLGMRLRTGHREYLVALAATLASAATIIAWWARPLLRAALRVLLPEPSRCVFEELWRVDGKLPGPPRW